MEFFLHPTRVIGYFETLIDNIFSSLISKEAICGNLMSTLSDHLPQLLIMPSIFSEPGSFKSNGNKSSWSNFKKEEFMLDYISKHWNLILNVEKMLIILLTIFV